MTKTTVSAPDREHRCRYRRRNQEMCPNPALDQSEDALIYVCVRHATRVLALVREQQARVTKTHPTPTPNRRTQ
ncbi:hypothetical protein ACIBEJ_48800 [Nonomuraea sp. NPDC050790]|uniref:hypothetical protein n=1 Tax=Nonomuraea sp. NPDC050790 TaxID=3364371 RepID=UPI003795AF8A